MSLEQVLVFTLMLMFAAIHWLGRWRRGIQNPTNADSPAASEWETESRMLDPFDADEVEPPRLVESPRIVEPPRTVEPPRHAPPMRQPRRGFAPRPAPRPLPQPASRPGARPARPIGIHAGLRDGGVIPQNEAELRRAIALVAIFGPPRALDPP